MEKEKTMNYKASIVIPCYNEQDRLSSTLSSLTKTLPANYEIVVAADGCKDGTPEIARQWKVKLAFCPERLGKGGGILNGVKATTSEIIVVLDADLPIAPQTIPILIENFVEKNADLLVGKRLLSAKKDNKPKLRRLASNGFKWLRTKMFGPLPDTQCGVKIFRKSKIEKLSFSENGYAWDLELVLKAKRNEWNIIEYPLDYYHRENSKVNIVKTTLQIFLSMVRLWLMDPWRFLCLLLFLYAFGFSVAASMEGTQPIGWDYYFHLKVASIWASGENGMFSSFVLQINRFPYPPLFHWMLTLTLWFGDAFLYARLLQVVFPSGTVALTMLFVSRHGGGAKAAALTGVVFLSCLDFIELIQVRPQTLDMLLLPIALGSLISSRKKTFVISSLASVYSHGIAALANLYLPGLHKLRNRNWKRTILLIVMLMLPILWISTYYFGGALAKWGGHTANQQERDLWTTPYRYIPIHLGSSMIGLIFLVKAVKNWGKETELVKILVLTLIGSSLMFCFWADRWIQYATLPLSCLVGLGLSRIKGEKQLFIGWLIPIFIFYLTIFCLIILGNQWHYPISSEIPW